METSTSPRIEDVVRGINRSQLARTTPISLSHISRIFGGTRMPGSAKLKILATELDVPMDQLYDWLVAHRAPKRAKRRRTQ